MFATTDTPNCFPASWNAGGLYQGMIYVFVRACVHYALFEDEEYLKLQMDAIRTSLRLFVRESQRKEENL